MKFFGDGLLRYLESSKPEAYVVDATTTPSAAYLSSRVHVVATRREAEAMQEAVAGLRVGLVGVQALFGCGTLDPLADSRPDPSRLLPVAIGLAFMVHHGQAFYVVRYAVDVRREEVRPALSAVLMLPVRFVMHHVNGPFFALHNLALGWPKSYGCTWLAANLLENGLYDWRCAPTTDGARRREAQADERGATSIVELARRFGVVTPMGPTQSVMAERLKVMSTGAPLHHDDAAYVTADAAVAAQVYRHLHGLLLDVALDHHYEHVELPAALEFAAIEWQGVTVDGAKVQAARSAAAAAIAGLDLNLKQAGATLTPGGAVDLSHAAIERLLDSVGLLYLFPVENETASFAEDELENHRYVHPIVDCLYRRVKLMRRLGDPIFSAEATNSNGRVHPVIDPVGAKSGRPSFKRPNIVGVGKIFRPIVVPDDRDHGLAELDFACQEVFIAAAHFGDDALLADCAAGDPYCRMMRDICRDELSPEDDRLDDHELGRQRPELRDRMKAVTLAIMYGMTDDGLATRLNITVLAATALRRRFFSRYHALERGLRAAQQQLRDRGYTTTVTGLKRFRAGSGKLSAREERWAVNTPIQGGGACVLKLMLSRLGPFLREHGGRIVLPVFDAVVVQFPLAQQEPVIEGCRRIMVAAMKELYPATQPRIDVNVLDPSCWNKRGRSDSIERFLEDPILGFSDQQ